MLLTIAGLASAFSSVWGVFAWMWLGKATFHSAPLIGLCLSAALSFYAFVLYFARPRLSVIAAWALLSGEFISSFVDNLQACAGRHCGMSPFGIAWNTVRGLPTLWFLLAAAVCLMLVWTTSTKPPAPRGEMAGEGQDLGK